MLDAKDKFVGFTYCEDFAVPSSGWNSSLQKAAPTKSVEMNRDNKDMGSDRKKIEKCNIEPAIVKVAPKTAPECVCGAVLDVFSLETGIKDGVHVMCNQCSMVMDDNHISGQSDSSSEESNSTSWWCCRNGNKHYLHTNGYYLCPVCGDKRVKCVFFQSHCVV